LGRPPKNEGPWWVLKPVAYHLKLLAEKGFLVFKDVGGGFGEEDEYIGVNLTNLGHDALEKVIGDDSKWNRFKEAAFRTGKKITIDLLLEWLKGELPT
jgi:repressor of nif and glnA expression